MTTQDNRRPSGGERLSRSELAKVRSLRRVQLIAAALQSADREPEERIDLQQLLDSYSNGENGSLGAA